MNRPISPSRTRLARGHLEAPRLMKWPFIRAPATNQAGERKSDEWGAFKPIHFEPNQLIQTELPNCFVASRSNGELHYQEDVVSMGVKGSKWVTPASVYGTAKLDNHGGKTDLRNDTFK